MLRVSRQPLPWLLSVLAEKWQNSMETGYWFAQMKQSNLCAIKIEFPYASRIAVSATGSKNLQINSYHVPQFVRSLKKNTENQLNLPP